MNNSKGLVSIIWELVELEKIVTLKFRPIVGELSMILNICNAPLGGQRKEYREFKVHLDHTMAESRLDYISKQQSKARIQTSK